MFIYLTTRNQLWIIRRHARNAAMRRSAIRANAPSWMRTLAAVTLLGRWSKAKALVRGIRDGFRAADGAAQQQFLP